jgi:hypothetical protein
MKDNEFLNAPDDFWVGAINTTTLSKTTDAVWCVPGESDLSMKSPLSLVFFGLQTSYAWHFR